MNVFHITAENFENEVIKAECPIVLDFYADWCEPCRMMNPVLEEISNERRDVKVCKLNVDHALKLAAAYGISSIPTIVVIKDGRITDKSIGVTPKEVVLAMVDA